MAKNKKITRRQVFLLGLGMVATISTLPLARKLRKVNSQEQKPENRNFAVVGDATLKQRAATKRLIYGVASERSILTSDQKFTNIVTQESAMLVAEADLLWNALRPSPEDYDFSRGDWIAEFARNKKMLFGGTHLVWSQAMPSWFEEKVNQQNAREILLNHIETVAGHYAGKIHLWTVVNEAVDPGHGRDDGLSNIRWLQLLGPDYIEMAFRAAAKADPNALLLYNDNALEYDNGYHDKKRTAVLKLLERLKSKGTPIHGLGFQTHVGAVLDDFNPKKLSAFLHDVAQLGLKIVVTEMDVGDRELPTNINVRDRLIAGAYEDFLTTILAEPAVIGVITWGLSDKYTWYSWSSLRREDGTPARPLPYDANMQRKLAWNGIARAFDKADRRQKSQLWTAWRKLQ